MVGPVLSGYTLKIPPMAAYFTPTRRTSNPPLHGSLLVAVLLTHTPHTNAANTHGPDSGMVGPYAPTAAEECVLQGDQVAVVEADRRPFHIRDSRGIDRGY
jgi:hypothetical protein